MKIKPNSRNNVDGINMLYDTTTKYTSMPIYNWYLIRYGHIPNIYNSSNEINIDVFLYENKDKILYSENYFDDIINIDQLSCAIVEIDSLGTICYIEDCRTEKKKNFQVSRLKIFYSKKTTGFNNLKKYIDENRVKEEKFGFINLICNTNGGFELKQYKIKDPIIDLDLNYNDGFKEIDKLILSKLSEENGKGLVMLYGEPGTGKTSYVRRVINHVDKRVLYLPPDMATELSNPGLVPFLANLPNSILIIEDAENVLIKRSGQHNQAISNILNLSDGLLGDCLNIQIIATFNVGISSIDSALLRKGRLLAKYEFKKLSEERVAKLTEKIGVKFSKNTGTLAEIYNCSELDFENSSKKEIGFNISQ